MTMLVIVIVMQLVLVTTKISKHGFIYIKEITQLV